MKKILLILLSLVLLMSGCVTVKYSKEENQTNNSTAEVEETKESKHTHTLVDTKERVPGTYRAYNNLFYCSTIFTCECGYEEEVEGRISEEEFSEYMFSIKWNKFDFDDAERYPNKHKDGLRVAVAGYVGWVNFYKDSETKEETTELGVYLLDNTTLEHTYNYIVVAYPMGYGTNAGRLLEGDEITILGVEGGAYSYTSVNNGQITAPIILAAYIVRDPSRIYNVSWEK